MEEGRDDLVQQRKTNRGLTATGVMGCSEMLGCAAKMPCKIPTVIMVGEKNGEDSSVLQKVEVGGQGEHVLCSVAGSTLMNVPPQIPSPGNPSVPTNLS